ncbi:MAG: amidohydrolase [Chloroflexi bacterium]|nr:amidohydrolase [Chloroflexota bacterium]
MPRLDEVTALLGDELVRDRRHLHANPELGFEEHQTAAYVTSRLRALGIDTRIGVGRTGVLGTLEGARPGKTVLLRADMDALPIEEENDVPYRSMRRGVMHACGHDGHTAMLLGAARVLAARRDRLAGRVKLVFQPSEERFPGGALAMIDDGVLENPTVDAAFSVHLTNSSPAGTVQVCPGPAMASADSFTVVVNGRGGHASRPHQAVDSVLIAAKIVTTLHTIVSRNVDPLRPAVVTVGTIKAGEAENVIPERATLAGSVRSFDQEMRELLARRIHEVATGVATALGGSADVSYEYGYPPLVNDPAMTALVAEVARDLVGADKVLTTPPVMASEDMSYFLQKAPGCQFRLGGANEARGLTWTNHHPRFDVDDEAALPVGAALFVAIVERFLGD